MSSKTSKRRLAKLFAMKLSRTVEPLKVGRPVVPMAKSHRLLDGLVAASQLILRNMVSHRGG